MDSTTDQGVIVTFYSYKGGTGRSMALANSAYLAAKRLSGDERVLMIDWDLEAPGLHRYFPEAERDGQQDTPGLIEYFTKLNGILDPATCGLLSGPDGVNMLESLLPLGDYIVPEVEGRIDLLKAGRFCS